MFYWLFEKNQIYLFQGKFVREHIVLLLEPWFCSSSYLKEFTFRYAKHDVPSVSVPEHPALPRQEVEQGEVLLHPGQVLPVRLAGPPHAPVGRAGQGRHVGRGAVQGEGHHLEAGAGGGRRGGAGAPVIWMDAGVRPERGTAL